jgi:hypothetical protein
MSDEWAPDVAWKEVPTVTNITLEADAFARSAARAVNAVAGACPRGAVPAQPVQGSGAVAEGTAVHGDVVLARPRMQLKKYPFTTHGAVISGAELGPHRAWDPV